MNKIGTALSIYNANGFSEAFTELKKYVGIFSEDEQKILDQLDKSVAEKNEKFEKAVIKFQKKGFKFAKLTNSRNGKTSKITFDTFAEMSPDGKLKKSGYLFGLGQSLDVYQNIDLITTDAGRELDIHKAGLAKILKDHLKFNNGYGSKRFVYVPNGMESEYQKLFDTGAVINLSTLIDEAKATAKANRKARVAGDRVEAADAQLFTVRYFNANGGLESKIMSYNDIKSATEFEGKTLVVAIRDRNNDGQDYIVDVTIPTDKASEKTFTTSDIRIRSVRDGMLDTMKHFDRKDEFVLAFISASNYKRLKLWRDPEFFLEKEALKSIYEEELENVKPLEVLKYTDTLLDSNYLDRVTDAIEKAVTDEDKASKFYKRFTLAAKGLREQTSKLESAEYAYIDRRRDDLEKLNVQSPITYRTVTPELFADYPMLKYFGGSYGATIRIDYSQSTVRDMLDYVKLVESK